MALIRLNANNPDATNDYLITLTGKAVGTPPALDNVKRLGQVAQGNYTYVSVNVAASLGFGFGSISGSLERRVMTFDYAATANQVDSQDNGIDSWTYGAGYRIGILTFESEASAQLALSAVAATATLQNKNIQIQVLSYGMPGGPSVPLPDFAKFDVESYGLFTRWQRDVIEYINKNKANLDPVRIYASLSVDIDQYFMSTAPFRYALRRIQDKITLAQTLQYIRENQIQHVAGHESVIRAVYARITGYGKYLDESGPIDTQSIGDSAKRLAEEWIQQYDKG